MTDIKTLDLQKRLKHRLGILNVGNRMFQDLIDNTERYEVSSVHLSEMKNELEFLIDCIDEMEGWIKAFHKETPDHTTVEESTRKYHETPDHKTFGDLMK